MKILFRPIRDMQLLAYAVVGKPFPEPKLFKSDVTYSGLVLNRDGDLLDVKIGGKVWPICTKFVAFRY